MEILCKHLTEIREVDFLAELTTITEGDALPISSYVYSYPDRSSRFSLKARVFPLGLDVSMGPKRRRLPSITLIYALNVVVMGKAGLVQIKDDQHTALLMPFINSDRVFDKVGWNAPGIELLNLQCSNFEPVAPAKVKLISPMSIVREIDEPVFFFGTTKDANYSHFVWDSLPQLWYLAQLNDPKIKLLIEDDLPPYKIDFLGALGFDRNRVITRKRDEHILCKKIYIGSALAINNRWIFSQGLDVLKQLRTDGEVPKRRIFLDRNDDRREVRRILNEEELWEVCRQQGFERHTPGRMSLVEKQKLFGEAEIIVGQYGGGMQNHFLCQPKAKLIVLQSESFQREIFDYTSDMLGLNLISVFGATDRSNPNRRVTNNSDFTIDVKLFAAVLARMLRPDFAEFLKELRGDRSANSQFLNALKEN